jgi:hypothetical protein
LRNTHPTVAPVINLLKPYSDIISITTTASHFREGSRARELAEEKQG